MDNSVTLIQIRSFLAVVRHGGFTAAARALHTCQTTITSQIQAIEQEHGVELFERRGRRVELTSVGEEFLELARRMVGLEDDARLILGESGTLRRGSLRLGAVSMSAACVSDAAASPSRHFSMRWNAPGRLKAIIGHRPVQRLRVKLSSLQG